MTMIATNKTVFSTSMNDKPVVIKKMQWKRLRWTNYDI